MTRSADLKLVRVSMMNAIHDLAVLVARDEGLFHDEGHSEYALPEIHSALLR